MKQINTPSKLPLPFAAVGGKRDIPTASQIAISPGAASLEDGFPPLTRTPLAAGGIPPSGLDMNGILYELSAVVRWANAGGGFAYDAAFANDANVGGYPKGARVMRSDGQGYWFNTVDDNLTDPEAGGAGWVPDFAAGVTTITMTNANVTLTPLQYGKRVIAVSGLMVANLNLIFPDIPGNWLLVNNTTGAYSITAKTAAGVGVSVPSGTAEFLNSDGTNFYSLWSALALPTGATHVGYTEAGTGAVSRTVAAKLKEILSVGDIGADPTGGVNAVGVFQTAAARSSGTLVGPGTYKLDSIALGDFFSFGEVSTTGNGYAEITNIFDLKDTESRLRSALRMSRNDIYVLTQGDSTGNDTYEFFYVAMQALAKMFPAYTVVYKLWDHATTAWLAGVTIQTGTSGKTIYFYNGSFPGATPSYWTGNRNSLAYDGKTFDLIITNYGLNVPTSWRNQAERLAEYLYTLRVQQPKADVLVTVQPPDYTDATMLDRSAARADAQKWVCGQFGVQIIDVYDLFAELVARDGGVTTQWYIDNIHPTAAGGIKWAKAALRAMLTNGAKCSVGAPKKAEFAPTLMPNGNFNSWLNGVNAVPTFWASDSPAVVKNTVRFETFGASVRIDGSGVGTTILYVKGDDIVTRFKHAGGFWIAARVYSEGTSGKAGTVYMAHSVSTAYTEIQNTTGQPSESAAGWRWAFLYVDASFYAGKSDFRIGVFGGQAGEKASVDRIIISDTPFISDSNGVEAWKYRYSSSDSSFSVGANATVGRVFSPAGLIVQPGVVVKALINTALPTGLMVNPTVTSSGVIRVYFTNTTAVSITMPDYLIDFLTSIE